MITNTSHPLKQQPAGPGQPEDVFSLAGRGLSGCWLITQIFYKLELTQKCEPLVPLQKIITTGNSGLYFSKLLQPTLILSHLNKCLLFSQILWLSQAVLVVWATCASCSRLARALLHGHRTPKSIRGASTDAQVIFLLHWCHICHHPIGQSKFHRL